VRLSLRLIDTRLPGAPPKSTQVLAGAPKRCGERNPTRARCLQGLPLRRRSALTDACRSALEKTRLSASYSARCPVPILRPTGLRFLGAVRLTANHRAALHSGPDLLEGDPGSSPRTPQQAAAEAGLGSSPLDPSGERRASPKMRVLLPFFNLCLRSRDIRRRTDPLPGPAE
jgi:hypothetical protein